MRDTARCGLPIEPNGGDVTRDCCSTRGRVTTPVKTPMNTYLPTINIIYTIFIIFKMFVRTDDIGGPRAKNRNKVYHLPPNPHRQPPLGFIRVAIRISRSATVLCSSSKSRRFPHARNDYSRHPHLMRTVSYMQT